jgi:alpha-N-arabinofuranosidase
LKKKNFFNDTATTEIYTMADALFCASFFNACLRYADDVDMANISCLVNQTGPLYVHPKGIVKRTHFHAMAMYANLLQSRVVRTRVNAGRLTRGTESVAVVDAIATVDESGKKWTVAMINRCPSKEVACTLQMAEQSIDGTYKATVLTGDSPDSYNGIEHPRRVTPKKIELTFKKGDVSLPPHSLVIVDIPLEKSPLRDEQ